MLTLEAVSHSFGQGPVLEGVSLTLAPGQVLAITGPSGCGKTTLLHIAAGLLRPSQGSVTNTFTRSAYVFQEPRLLPWRTARQNLAFGLKAMGVAPAERRAAAERLAARLGLEGALDRYPHQLSGGMRQRVALGRALAVDPDLILLDEPFGALDSARRKSMQDLLLGLLAERGAAALFVTHDLSEAERVGDELLVLSPAPGRILTRSSTNRI
jgi:NitT/TauT family transport system ATP-binding protein